MNLTNVRTIQQLTHYVEYNYGMNCELAIACRTNDEHTFLRLASHHTQSTDIRLANACDKLCAARGRVAP